MLLASAGPWSFSGEDLSLDAERAVTVDATPEEAWSALMDMVEGGVSGGRPSQLFARILGSPDVEPGGPRPLDVGSTFPGGHIAHSRPPLELVLEGQDRFGRYRLVCAVEEQAAGGSRLSVTLWSAMRRQRGRVYRLLTLGRLRDAVTVRMSLGLLLRYWPKWIRLRRGEAALGIASDRGSESPNST